MWCSCFGRSNKKRQQQYQAPPNAEPSAAEKEARAQQKQPEQQPLQLAAASFKHVPEPILHEVSNYVKHRGSAIHLYATVADARAELLRNVNESIQQVDIYPKGRQMLQDEEYMLVLKDLLNLSNILDDMEQTGAVPYPSRTQYYNLHSKLYRLLQAKAKAAHEPR